MAYLLALETTSTLCSVALFKEEQLLGISELQIEKSHSSHITVLIDALLQNCKVSLHDLSAIVLSGGPGSYTGLRIGSSTAKGLCFALDIPLIEVPTLKALAAAAVSLSPDPGAFLYCPMIDARRMEVYATLVDQHLAEVLPVSPMVLTEESFEKEFSGHRLLFFGSGAAKCRDLLGHQPNACFLEALPLSARWLGSLGLEKYRKGLFEQVAYYEPFYLKEVHITSSNKKS
ncbi:MAG: tRNA (adenosine(37)-N6)-threonylcarbamoyltransferase complex dimerization subunit type 1 TsaB [Adhaeribacter sp.]